MNSIPSFANQNKFRALTGSGLGVTHMNLVEMSRVDDRR